MSKKPYRDPTDEVKGTPRQELAWRAFNYIVGVLALGILALAIVLPSAIGHGDGRASERYWQVAAAGALLWGVWILAKRLSYSILLLVGSVVFTMASCVMNFHWRGG